MGVVSDNPCTKVTIPKSEVKEKQIYSQEELEMLLNKLIDEPTKVPCVLLSDFLHGFAALGNAGLGMEGH